MAEYTSATSVEEKKIIENKIKTEYSSLSKEEKEKVQSLFLRDWDREITETKEVLDYVKLQIALDSVGKYVSLSYIASKYFNKTRFWIHNKLRGYNVNGKPAFFTPEEVSQLKFALHDISKHIEQASNSF